MSLDQINRKISDLTKIRKFSLSTDEIKRAKTEITALESQRDRLTNSNSFSGRFIANIGSMVRQTRPLKMSLDQINEKIEDLTKSRALSLDTKQIRRTNAEIAALEGKRDRLTNSSSSSGMLSGFLGMAADVGKSMLSAGMDKQLKEAGDKGGQGLEMTGRQAKTAAGSIIILQNSISALSASVGSDLLNAMSPLISVAQYLVDYPELLMGIAAALGFLAVALEWAAIKQAFLNFVMQFNPMMLLVTFIILVIAAIVHLARKYEGWGQAMQALWTVIKAWCSNVGIHFKDFFQEVIFRAEMFWLRIKQIFQFVGGAVSNLMNALKLALQFKFADAKAALTAEIKTGSVAKEIASLEQKRKSQRAENMIGLATGNKLMGTSVWGQLKPAPQKKRDLSMPGATPDMAAPSGIPDTLKDTNSGITGGGTKNIHINVQKFFEHLNIYSASVAQGLDDTEQRVKEMLLRVINSTSQSVS